MGIQPTYPSEKYGYIKPQLDGSWGFTEKPDAVRAQEYIDAGALWNGGVFAYKEAMNKIDVRTFEKDNPFQSINSLQFKRILVQNEMFEKFIDEVIKIGYRFYGAC